MTRSNPVLSFARPLALTLILMLAPLSALPVSAQPDAPPQLTMEQTTSLRCAAAFALVADAQSRGSETAQAYPPLEERGREYFVRASARLMDETGMDRPAIAALLQKQAQDIWNRGEIDRIMPACLVMLEASGI